MLWGNLSKDIAEILKLTAPGLSFFTPLQSFIQVFRIAVDDIFYAVHGSTGVELAFWCTNRGWGLALWVFAALLEVSQIYLEAA